MSNVEVLSRPQRIIVDASRSVDSINVYSWTQKIVVSSTKSVSIINAGPIGPRGLTGAQGIPGISGDLANSVTGTILVENLVWVVTHNLNILEASFNPGRWWFENENGIPMEPESIDWVNPNVATVSWLDPVRGTWITS